jgi:NitT/TauT family transport system substrate-binding protein
MLRVPAPSMRFVLLALLALGTAAHAETIKIGLLKTSASGPVFIAEDMGYFAAEGLDAELVPGSLGVAMLARGDAKLLSFMGDETPFQLAGSFASRKTADERGDTVRHFLRALQHASRDYHDAFVANGKRGDGPAAPEMLAIIAKATGQSPDDVARGLPYVDGEARLDVGDVIRQYEWYRSQGMLKGAADAATMIDRRYVVDVKP